VILSNRMQPAQTNKNSLSFHNKPTLFFSI